MGNRKLIGVVGVKSVYMAPTPTGLELSIGAASGYFHAKKVGVVGVFL